MRKEAHATMGPKPLTIRARIALMAALGLALIALGPMADAQTTSSIPAAQNAKSNSDKSKSDAGKAADAKNAYAKDTKSKSSKDAKSKDKSKDAKSKNAKAAKSDPKAGKSAP